MMDKRIPISLLIAIVMQTGSAFWWASSIAARIDTQDKRLAVAEEQLKETNKIMTDLRVTLAVVNTQLAATQRVLDRRSSDGTTFPTGP